MIRSIRTLLQWIHQHLELMFWVIALVSLFFLPAHKTETSLCLFSLLGFHHCPGCGLGHSIYYALHLDPASSFRHHPMGIFAVLVIFIRIKQLLHLKKTAHETQPSQHDPLH